MHPSIPKSAAESRRRFMPLSSPLLLPVGPADVSPNNNASSHGAHPSPAATVTMASAQNTTPILTLGLTSRSLSRQFVRRPSYTQLAGILSFGPAAAASLRRSNGGSNFSGRGHVIDIPHSVLEAGNEGVRPSHDAKGRADIPLWVGEVQSQSLVHAPPRTLSFAVAPLTSERHSRAIQHAFSAPVGRSGSVDRVASQARLGRNSAYGAEARGTRASQIGSLRLVQNTMSPVSNKSKWTLVKDTRAAAEAEKEEPKGCFGWLFRSRSRRSVGAV